MDLHPSGACFFQNVLQGIETFRLALKLNAAWLERGSIERISAPCRGAIKSCPASDQAFIFSERNVSGAPYRTLSGCMLLVARQPGAPRKKRALPPATLFDRFAVYSKFAGRELTADLSLLLSQRRGPSIPHTKHRILAALLLDRNSLLKMIRSPYGKKPCRIWSVLMAEELRPSASLRIPKGRCWAPDVAGQGTTSKKV